MNLSDIQVEQLCDTQHSHGNRPHGKSEESEEEESDELEENEVEDDKQEPHQSAFGSPEPKKELLMTTSKGKSFDFSRLSKASAGYSEDRALLNATLVDPI